MAKVVRVSTPSHFQVRKDVAIVDRKNRLTSLINILGALCRKRRGIFAGKSWQAPLATVEFASSFVSIALLSASSDTLLLYVRQTHRDISCEREPCPLLVPEDRTCASDGYDNRRTASRIWAGPQWNLASSRRLTKVRLFPLSSSRYSIQEMVCLPRRSPHSGYGSPDQRELRVCLRSCRRRSALA